MQMPWISGEGRIARAQNAHRRQHCCPCGSPEILMCCHHYESRAVLFVIVPEVAVGRCCRQGIDRNSPTLASSAAGQPLPCQNHRHLCPTRHHPAPCFSQAPERVCCLVAQEGDRWVHLPIDARCDYNRQHLNRHRRRRHYWRHPAHSVPCSDSFHRHRDHICSRRRRGDWCCGRGLAQV